MTVLQIAVTTDFSGQTLTGPVTDLIFLNGASFPAPPDPPVYTSAEARFSAAQADGDPIPYGLRITGSAGNNIVTVAGGSVNAAGWSFVDWQPEVFTDPTVFSTLSDLVQLIGGGGADVLTGTAFYDLLDGLGGADIMAGGGGNDGYRVSEAGDFVVEGAGQGHDTVHAAVSWTLGANTEDLFLGNASLDGTGNGLDNSIAGGDGANILQGLAGNDRLFGYGAAGGSDRLDGGTGSDFMHGGSGSHTYVVDQAGDVVSESASGTGTDTVEASLSYTLSAAIENLKLTGGAGISGFGNGSANVLTGNAAANAMNGNGGNDTLRGAAGNDALAGGLGSGSDVLEGGAGQDVLTGGGGLDQFVFRSVTESGVLAAARDRIADFSVDPAGGAGFIDRINLSVIDARAGNAEPKDVFSFIGSAAFTAEGQVRAYQSGSASIVEMNTTGIGGADSAILLSGFTAASLSAADFVL